jgi:imidazolonepropionase-like amidohydrolase
MEGQRTITRVERQREGAPAILHLRGVVLPEGVRRDVFVVDGRITFRAPSEASTVLDGGYLLPGLVDAHAHLGLASPAGPGARPADHARESARAQLEAGVLVVREPGGPNRLSAGIGPQEGLPRTFTGGRFLAPPGSYFAGLAREVTEAELPDAAEEEAQASGAWAKVIGDWPGADGTMRLNYRAEVLAEAARRVHAAGARMAVHATTAATVEAAIEGGFDSIEHGEGLQEDHIAAMASRGIALVPTLTILPMLPDFIAGLGLQRTATQAMLAAVRGHPEMTRKAFEAGVLVLAGTDAGMGPHGMIGEEIRLLTEAGVPPKAALAAGSWVARRYLGLPSIEEGAPADIVAYADDPFNDLSALQHPLLRILDGRLMLPSAVAA